MQIWPPQPDPATLSRQVWDAQTARNLPGIGRVLSLYGGLISQMSLSEARGIEALPPSRFLTQPDPERVLSSFVSAHVEDYLLHGNAAHLVTVRNERGYPAAVRWFPASWWQLYTDQTTGTVVWYLRGQRVPTEDVVHVARGADPNEPARGIGIVEQHTRSLDRAGLQEEYERNSLRGAGMPSVAIIAPQRTVPQDEADDLATEWEKRFGGPTRRPGIFPNGTDLKPLSWSPTDQQLVLARQLTSTDLANMANLDPYWLGAPGSSHTYRSAGSMFVALLRTSLEPVLAPFEQTWTAAWLPYGRRVRFDRVPLTRDDLATMVNTGATAVREGLMTVDEWRAMQGLAPFGGDSAKPRTPTTPAPTPEAAADETDPDPDVEVEADEQTAGDGETDTGREDDEQS